MVNRNETIIIAILVSLFISNSFPYKLDYPNKIKLFPKEHVISDVKQYVPLEVQDCVRNKSSTDSFNLYDPCAYGKCMNERGKVSCRCFRQYTGRYCSERKENIWFWEFLPYAGPTIIIIAYIILTTLYGLLSTERKKVQLMNITNHLVPMDRMAIKHKFFFMPVYDVVIAGKQNNTLINKTNLISSEISKASVISKPEKPPSNKKTTPVKRTPGRLRKASLVSSNSRITFNVNKSSASSQTSKLPTNEMKKLTDNLKNTLMLSDGENMEEKDRRLIHYNNFLARLEDEMRNGQKACGLITRFFQEPRHVEDIRGIIDLEDPDKPNWRRNGKDRMKTVSVAIVLCLHIGIDPPDAPPKPEMCSKKLAWVDPFKCGPLKAAHDIALSLQKSYERWQPRAKTVRYKIACDPPIDDVRKIATNLRRVSGGDRILFHYNGMGVPRPTDNGEIWVFNKSFTQYIPLSVYDLQSWLEFPAVYVWECHSAGAIITAFQRFADDHQKNWQSDFDKWQEEKSKLPAISSTMDQAEQAQAMGYPEKFPKFHDCIHLAACRAGELLPLHDKNMPADLFTSCLTTPVHTAILWYLVKTDKLQYFPENILETIPGNLNERKTVLGELNWIFTAITDTIAFTSIERDIFQKLFRQDLLLASLFRSFLLAQRIMSDYDVLPISWPHLKNTSEHELWSSWDTTLDLVMNYVRELIFIKNHNVVSSGREILLRSQIFPYITTVDFSAYHATNDNTSNSFFVDQLKAFDMWLTYGIDRGSPPLQLPVVLQVLLSQTHRVTALGLLAKFLDFGRWAVGYSLSVGIFPYVLRLLQSSTKELRPHLAFIWAKILAVDPSCQNELFKENGDDSIGSAAASNQPRPSPLPSSNVFSVEEFQRADRHGVAQLGARFAGSHVNDRTQQFIQQHHNFGHMTPSPRSSMHGPIKKIPAPLRYIYFVQILNDPETPPRQKIVAAFVLAMLTHNNYKVAQENLTEKGFVNLCTELLCDPVASKSRLLKLWLLIGMGRLWSDYDDARWQAIRLVSYDQVIKELEDVSPEVRAAAVFALGSLLKNSSHLNEHASAIDEEIADELCTRCVFDGSVLVREELIVALQWFVFDFMKRFVKIAHDLSKSCNFEYPAPKEEPTDDDEEGIDVASTLRTQKSHQETGDFTQRSVYRKKMSTSVFNAPFTEEVWSDARGQIRSMKQEVGTIEREPEDDDYKSRAQAQIKFLESKTFNEPIARTWLALLRLSLDPVENVARMAQKIVKKVEEGAYGLEMEVYDFLSRHVVNGKFKIKKLDDDTQVRKASSAGVTSLDAPTTKSEKMAITEKLERVKFQIGSPGQENNENESDSQSVASNRSSEDLQLKALQKEQQKKEMLEKYAAMPRKDFVAMYFDQDTISGAKRLTETGNAFTPKRRTDKVLKGGNFSSKTDSASLRDVINNPLVTTEFVPWCSRIFVEPILDILGERSEENDDNVLTKTSLSDWAIHAMEGMKQSADIEYSNYKNTRYDHCLWKVNLTHPVSSLVTSRLRRCMYATDGKMLTIIRQDTDPRTFRKFDLTDSNPFNTQNVSELILINETSREMIIACSRNGVIRIWDPCFTSWSDDYESPPQLISGGFPLGDQTRLSDENGSWHQDSGRLICTGTRSVHIWDAHYEKTVSEIPYPSGFVTSMQPTSMSADLDDDLIAVGYGDGQIDVFDLRTPRFRATRIPAVCVPTTSVYEKNAPSIMHLRFRRSGDDGKLFAGTRDGVISMWDPRKSTDPIITIEAPWMTGQHTNMSVHHDAKMCASASDSTIMIFDVASGDKMAKILPPVNAVDFERYSKGTFSFLKSSERADVQRRSSNNSMLPKVTALTMHQMRLMTVAGYDDNSVCVYGALKPGLTADPSKIGHLSNDGDILIPVDENGTILPEYRYLLNPIVVEIDVGKVNQWDGQPQVVHLEDVNRLPASLNEAERKGDDYSDGSLDELVVPPLPKMDYSDSGETDEDLLKATDYDDVVDQKGEYIEIPLNNLDVRQRPEENVDVIKPNPNELGEPIPFQKEADSEEIDEKVAAEIGEDLSKTVFDNVLMIMLMKRMKVNRQVQQKIRVKVVDWRRKAMSLRFQT
ncbi:unnamed protein product [Caenorhabditis bovis]|uniref:EGF-like domain-containing protein n=1 Tax=Caenorhabditis bovis TaxID=2654633 RepID=A0A8S1FA30_9PELO|nr:unnamed protein product [Caenorhabditis bovis]